MNQEKKECGVMIHTRGWQGVPGPVYCANEKPCKMHKPAEDWERVRWNPLKKPVDWDWEKEFMEGTCFSCLFSKGEEGRHLKKECNMTSSWVEREFITDVIFSTEERVRKECVEELEIKLKSDDVKGSIVSLLLDFSGIKEPLNAHLLELTKRIQSHLGSDLFGNGTIWQKETIEEAVEKELSESKIKQSDE